jgi:hypothetical protein
MGQETGQRGSQLEDGLGVEYFQYDNPEYQGCLGPQAAGWFVRFNYRTGEVVRMRRVEGLCDPNFRKPRFPPSELLHTCLPPAVFTGTQPKPADYGLRVNG